MESRRSVLGYGFNLVSIKTMMDVSEVLVRFAGILMPFGCDLGYFNISLHSHIVYYCSNFPIKQRI